MTGRRDGRMRVDERLHEELQGLARAIEFPRAPDLAPRVRARIVGQPGPVPGRRLARLPLMVRLAGVAVALLVALAAALAVTPATRDALARFFGLKRVQIIYEDSTEATATPQSVTPVPTITPAASAPMTPPGSAPTMPVTEPTATPPAIPATATPVPTRTLPALSGATTLDDARRRAPFQVLLPAYPENVGDPDEVYLQELGGPGEMQLILRYSDAARSPGRTDRTFTLYQFKATGIFMKTVGSGTRLQEVQVRGATGYWLEGAVHLIEYRTADGAERVEFKRQVVGNTLAWEVGDMTYRLETSLPLDEALRIAESLR